jgi:hypothetical protein
MKTFDTGSRNQSTQGNYSIRENKMEPLRRKLTSNITGQSNTRRIGGGELLKLGQKLTEMPKQGDDENKTFQNNSLVNNQVNSNSIIVPTKNGNAGSIISRAAAA